MCESCDVLQSSYQSANAMTFTFCDYGEGNMGQGIRKFAKEMYDVGKNEGYALGYGDGYINCLIDGVVIISFIGVVCFTIKSIKRKVDNRKSKRKQEICESI